MLYTIILYTGSYYMLDILDCTFCYASIILYWIIHLALPKTGNYQSRPAIRFLVLPQAIQG